MRNVIKIFKVLLVLVCVVLAWKLRSINYDQVPTPGQSLDEYSYSWMGMSLVEMGYPVGISGIEGYKVNDRRYINVDRIYQKSTGVGTPVTINYPWFDHPPLMGLITGGFAYIKGARNFEEAATFLIRKPMIYMGVLSVLLVFILGYLNFGYVAGILAALIYASSPLTVIGSRMIQAENGLIPVSLAALIAISMYRKNEKIFWLYLSAILAGIATLFKVSGVSVFLALGLFLYSQEKKDKFKLKIDLITLAVVYGSWVSLFFIYGAIYDWGLFKTILATNSNRHYGIGVEALYNLVVQTKVTGNKYLTDAWPLAGLIAAGLVMAKKKLSRGNGLVLAAFGAYLAIYLFFGSESYGWYTLPFWPYLYVMIGNVLNLAWKDSRRIFGGVLLLLLPIGLNLSKIINGNDLKVWSGWWKSGLVILILGGLIFRFGNKGKWNTLAGRCLLFGLLAAAVYLNYRVVNMMTIDYWYKVN